MCGREIAVGEEYSYESGKFYGDFFTRYLHMDCFDVMTELLAKLDDNEFAWGELCDIWMGEKCYECKKRYPQCSPDERCSYPPHECPWKTEYGTCKTDDECDIMDRNVWCTQYESTTEAIT
jgi:hypothetical protein